MPPTRSGRPLLERLGLHRPALRAWAMYDWANSAMVTVIITAVFPSFFTDVAASTLDPTTATSRFSLATTLALILIAVLAPLLGTLADYAANKLRMLAAFLVLGVAATGMMFFLERGEWLLALVLFGVANIGVNGSFVFYDALLPHVATADEVDRVSTAGYALGYVGGGLVLALALAMILAPDTFGLPAGEGISASARTLPVRLSFLLTALWWGFFSIPLFRRIHEPPPLPRRADEVGLSAVQLAGRQLRRTYAELRRYPQALLLLFAFLIYNDGIGTIIRMAVIYGREIGIGRDYLIGSILVVQFVGIPFAFLFGALAGRIGAKRAIYLGLLVYAGISIFAYFMQTGVHFLILALLVGTVQGGTQALSRSLFASMIPAQKSGEFFGFFAVFEKFAGIFGPLIFYLMLQGTGSSRAAILSIIVFFGVGALLLGRVDVSAGRALVRQHSTPAA